MADTADTVNPMSVLDLADCEYLLLTTYTKDGRAKPTPVWAAADGDALVMVTALETWKVRRVHNIPEVTLSACDARGNPRGGPVRGVAVLVDGVLVDRVEAALARKYGWKHRTVVLARRFSWRMDAGGQRGVVIRDVPAA